MTAISLTGQMLGAILAGHLMHFGRKKVIMFALILANLACIPGFIMNFKLFLTLRAVLAICLGVFYATAARYIEEYLPLKSHGVSWASIQVMAQAGILETICLSFLFPQTSNEITQEEVDELLAAPGWWVIPV